MSKKHKKKKFDGPLTAGDEMIKSGNINILTLHDKDIMLKYLRKVVLELEDIRTFFAQFDLTPEQNLRLSQYITNNKARLVQVIWGLTGDHLKYDEKNDPPGKTI